MNREALEYWITRFPRVMTIYGGAATHVDHPTLVIPRCAIAHRGCASWRRPGIHTPGGGYGFPDAQLRIVARARARPGMTDSLFMRDQVHPHPLPPITIMLSLADRLIIVFRGGIGMSIDEAQAQSDEQ